VLSNKGRGRPGFGVGFEKMEKLNGLDLFSGIGGIGLALEPWVRTVAYCEREPYAQGVLLSRMQSGEIDRAPIWDDVTTLRGDMLPRIDIVFGGFPCQDLSVAGAGKGLAGERSGLFFEIIRLVKEISPRFVFLENVPAIRTRGLSEVVDAFTKIGYDCRWTCLSASDVGAPHKRERWFLLASPNSKRKRLMQGTREALRSQEQETVGQDTSNVCKKIAPLGYSNDNGRIASTQSRSDGKNDNKESAWANGSCEFKRAGEHREVSKDFSNMAHTNCDTIRIEQRWIFGESGQGAFFFGDNGEEGSFPNSSSKRLERQRQESCRTGAKFDYSCNDSWWSVEPAVGRVANGIPNRVHRIKCLGNGVVPLQVRTAFQKLAGID
jgi:DNA (cytosine-5)-methyltransferase 1